MLGPNELLPVLEEMWVDVINDVIPRVIRMMGQVNMARVIVMGLWIEASGPTSLPCSTWAFDYYGLGPMWPVLRPTYILCSPLGQRLWNILEIGKVALVRIRWLQKDAIEIAGHPIVMYDEGSRIALLDDVQSYSFII